MLLRRQRLQLGAGPDMYTHRDQCLQLVQHNAQESCS